MSKNLDIELKCTGDGISALSEAHKIAKAMNERVYLRFPKRSMSVGIYPESYIHDLVTIYKLKCDLIDKIEEGKDE